MMQDEGAKWASRQYPIIIKKLLPVYAPDFMQITSTAGSKKSAKIWRAHGYLPKLTSPGILGETSEPTLILFSTHSAGSNSAVIALGVSNDAIFAMMLNLLHFPF